MRSVIIGVCAWVVAAGAADLEVRVRLEDYANVPEVWLTKAKTTAATILEDAGVRVSWSDCSPNSERRDSLCTTPPGLIDLHIRILSEEMAKRAQGTRHCMGYAIVSGRFPVVASAFYHRALELETGNWGVRAVVLGGIMAHEIGHLLLAETSHSEQGVLRARWGDQELLSIARGRLRFTPEQAERMVSLVAERISGAQPMAEFRP